MVRPVSRRELIRRFLGLRVRFQAAGISSLKKGELKVRIPNPHKSGTLNSSLVKEILRQAGIEVGLWESA
jgi:uncharacterized protein YggU (UPF0235/DUF167 family)